MIRLERLCVDVGEFHLRDIDLTIEKGEYLVLLGPTGAGKTVLVESVVGIVRPSSGRILIDGVDVSAHYPEERNVGYVPQDFALFPNMTVARNIAYGLEARHWPPVEIENKVQAMTDALGISHLRDRLPLHLSGGEKQRAALGRALITEPHILLLDEPLSTLHESLRAELAAELRRVQRTLGGTFLHVCHSLEEAAEVADRVAILNEGTFAQVGTIDQLLRAPASEFVARFTGTRNIFRGCATPAASGSEIVLDGGPTLHADRVATGRVLVTVRPETVRLGATRSISDNNVLSGRVVRRRRGLTYDELEVDVGTTWIVRAVPGTEQPTSQPDDRVQLRIPPDAIGLTSLPDDDTARSTSVSTRSQDGVR
jgi:ABC-type Fe3+/spermidine/putrescine transport system ATPase subunit